MSTQEEPVTSRDVAGIGKALYRTGDRATAERKLNDLAARADGPLAMDLRGAALVAAGPCSGSQVRKVVAALIHRHWPEAER